MIIFFRILGFLSLIITLMWLLVSSITEGLSGPEIGLILFGAAWTILWFLLAQRFVRRRASRIHAALMAPCTHCGLGPGEGYRICSGCGRVKDPVLL